MTFYSTIPVVSVALVASGNVLMQRRPPEKEHGGLWEFPGGKIEPGESPEAALVRELDEELGISMGQADLAPLSFSSGNAGNGRHILLLLYTCRNWLGEPEARDGAELAWCDSDALSALDMPPLDVPLAEALKPLLKGVAKVGTPS